MFKGGSSFETLFSDHSFNGVGQVKLKVMFSQSALNKLIRY